MIKVFLVEDEKIIRKSIKNNVKWEENGFEFAGEAPDGEMALPMIDAEFTDGIRHRFNPETRLEYPRPNQKR